MQGGEIELLRQPSRRLMYVGGIASFSKKMVTTIYGMTAQYWKSVISRGLTLPRRNTSKGIVLWDENYLTPTML